MSQNLRSSRKSISSQERQLQNRCPESCCSHCAAIKKLMRRFEQRTESLTELRTLRSCCAVISGNARGGKNPRFAIRFGNAGVKSAQVCQAYKFILSRSSQILLLTLWPIPIKQGLATGISKHEKVHHSRFFGHRRVLARPVSYGCCSNVSYTSPKSLEHR